jgi:hypothetical protein
VLATRDSLVRRKLRIVEDLDPNWYPDPDLGPLKLLPYRPISDAILWNHARDDILRSTLDSAPRLYHAGMPHKIPTEERHYDAWYITHWSPGYLTTQLITVETVLYYPKWYTVQLNSLNRHIRALLLTLHQDPMYEADSSDAYLVCLCGYLVKLREMFTSELYEATVRGEMHPGWRSRWLNPWLHRERVALAHDWEGRRTLFEEMGGNILQTDASVLGKKTFIIIQNTNDDDMI